MFVYLGVEIFGEKKRVLFTEELVILVLMGMERVCSRELYVWSLGMKGLGWSKGAEVG